MATPASCTAARVWIAARSPSDRLHPALGQNAAGSPSLAIWPWPPRAPKDPVRSADHGGGPSMATKSCDLMESVGCQPREGGKDSPHMALVDSTQQLLEAAMRGSWQRETALTNNIANADTPGYQPQEVNFESALQSADEQRRIRIGEVQFQTDDQAAGSRTERHRREHRSGIREARRKRPRLPGAHTGAGRPQQHHALGDRDA